MLGIIDVGAFSFLTQPSTLKQILALFELSPVLATNSC